MKKIKRELASTITLKLTCTDYKESFSEFSGYESEAGNYYCKECGFGRIMVGKA